VALLSFLRAVALGWAVAELSAPSANGWSRAANAAIGVPLGLGLTSFLYFVLLWLGARSMGVFAGLETAALLAAGWVLWKRPATTSVPPVNRFRYWWILAIAAACAALMGIAAVAAASEMTPHGDWDAWAIWNVRAKFLAGPGDAWRYSVSPALTKTHPDYPLLVSGAVARVWRLGGGGGPEAAATLALAWFASVPAILAAGIGSLRSVSAGLLAVLVLMATPSYLAQGPSQYADIPLSACLLGAALCAMRRQPALCGMLCACAAWTKNEGLVFALALLAACAWFQGVRASAPAWAAAAPGLAVVAAFKLLLAPGSEYAGRTPDFSRLPTVLAAFGRELGNLSLGDWLTHPFLLMAALAWGLRFAKDGPWLAGWKAVAAALGAQCAAYGTVYLMTPSDVEWQVGTSMERLVAQVWPAAVALFATRLNVPDDTVAASAPPASATVERSGGKSRRRRAQASS